MQIVPATPGDADEIDALLDSCFGAARHARTAYRLRAGTLPIPALSLLARAADGRLLGSIQYWRLELVADGTGVAQPMTLLGPLAVLPEARRGGVGGRLMAASLALAQARGHDAVLLIGDASYYGRFGFDAAATGGWRMPGPVEPERLLLRQTLPPRPMMRPLPRLAEVRAVRSTAAAVQGGP